MTDQDLDSKTQIGVYLPTILLEKIKIQASQEDRSVNNTIVRALKEAFLPEDSEQAN